jgi:hypothetical protein
MQAHQQFPTPPQPPPPNNDPVIELLDDDDFDAPPQIAGAKRQLSQMSNNHHHYKPSHQSYRGRNAHTPSWMKNSAAAVGGTKIVPGQSIPEYQLQQQQQREAKAARERQMREMRIQIHEPIYIQIPSSFTPTWKHPLPAVARHSHTQELRQFELSLLNVQEFTITGLPVTFEGPPSSVAGLRKTLREISRDYGKATFEREGDDGGGRWRIPLVSCILLCIVFCIERSIALCALSVWNVYIRVFGMLNVFSLFFIYVQYYYDIGCISFLLRLFES